MSLSFERSKSRPDVLSHVGITISLNPSKIKSLSKLLNDEKHIGCKLSNVTERIRWVRRPGTTDGDDIVWWPGILYNGFLELMVDLDYRLSGLRAACLVHHNRTKQTKPTVVYFIGSTEPPFARSISYKPTLPSSPTTETPTFGLDNDGQNGPDIKNYFDSYDEMQKIADANHSVSAETKARFHQSVAFADRLMAMSYGDEGAVQVGGVLPVEGDEAGDTARHTKSLPVSPEGRTDCNVATRFDVKVVNVHRAMKMSPVEGGNDGENGDDGDDRFSHQSGGGTPPQKIGGKGGMSGKARISTTPETADTSLSSTSYEKSNWKNVWAILKRKGWTLIDGYKYNTLHDWYYVRPDCHPKSKDCKLGTHYFMNSMDVIIWCRNKREIQRSSGKGDNHPRPEELGSMSDISADSPSTASSTSSVPRKMKYVHTLIKGKKSWPVIWKKLQELDWHWTYGRGLVDIYYIRPGRLCAPKNTVGDDYFESPKAVLEYLRKQQPNTGQASSFTAQTPPTSRVNAKRKRASTATGHLG